ncbi:MAG: EAL domain-containing protein, partial [Peptococcaceae bacterium]|nr:EAL domain-containing protein [Peptococcaceae bacterium]
FTITDYPLERVMGQNMRILHSGPQDDNFYRQMWDTISSGQMWRGELVNRRASGTSYYEEMTIAPVYTDDTEITHFIAIKQDVSERYAILKALSDSEERYREMFDNMRNAVAVFELSADGQDIRVKAFNRVAIEMDKIQTSKAIGSQVERIFPRSLGLADLLRYVYRTGEPTAFPAVNWQHGDVSSWREGFVYKLSTGEVVVIYEDVTKRKQDEVALWLEKERAQITLASIGDAVITADVDGRITYLNPVAEELTGWTTHQAEGLSLLKVFNIVNESTGQAVNNPVTQCIREKRIVSLANHTVLNHRDGHAFAIEDSAAPICDREGNVIGAVLVFHDVSDKRDLIRQLSHQAHHDALTGLPNRLLFNDRAGQAIAQSHRRKAQVAILFIDLDRFKLINDTLGHSMGDQLLRATSERLQTRLREGDTVARQGGDEFLVLLPALGSESQAALVAQQILDLFSEPFQLREQEVYVTASIGIALYPADGEDVETLIKHADTAMYQTKDQGRNHYQFYTLALNQSLSERLALQNDLRRALDRQEFILHYQPKYRLQDGQFCGLEALVRWQHPERGLLLPGEFIAIAEDSGLILALGEWVLREACTQNKRWQLKGYRPVRVAVNLSARQFRQANLVSQIDRILSETGLAPEWLELEITESVGMENLDFSLSMLQELKKMGISLSMDDFGTGFSSLSYLSRFPLDTLKIDRSFVSRLSHGQDGQAIVTTIVQLAQNLNLKVIAEGVETEEQLNFLRLKQCDEVQGFLFARPVPEEVVVTYFNQI